jgi:hypothetical protein
MLETALRAMFHTPTGLEGGAASVTSKKRRELIQTAALRQRPAIGRRKSLVDRGRQNSLGSVAEMGIGDDKLARDEVERILHSETLHHCEVLQRLLSNLAEKSRPGEADPPKEDVVLTDGSQRPTNGDSRHDATFRIQVSRLRQKLADYYRTEGLNDPIRIDLPKGHFELTWEPRGLSAEVPPLPVPTATISNRNHDDAKLRKAAVLLQVGLLVWVCAAVTIALGAYSWLRPWSAKATNISAVSDWTPELEDLWGPFVVSSRPLIVAIEDPLFVELRVGSGVYYRDRSLNNWKDVSTSPAIAALRGALNNPEIGPSQSYTAFGEVDAAFLVGKLLGSHVRNFSLVKASEVTLRQLGDNNVLFVGIQNLFFNDQVSALPIEPQLLPVQGGIRNQSPKPGEPALFADQHSAQGDVVYALVTHVPGPLGSNEVGSLTSNRSGGYVAAVQWLTNPRLARVLVDKLKQASDGRMPHYYQVLLKVKFKDDVPTETTCVLVRELR